MFIYLIALYRLNCTRTFGVSIITYIIQASRPGFARVDIYFLAQGNPEHLSKKAKLWGYGQLKEQPGFLASRSLTLSSVYV